MCFLIIIITVKLTGLKNIQPEDDDISVSELFKSVDCLVLYCGALASAMHTRSGIGYKLNEWDASGQYKGHISRGTVIKCDWLSNVFIYCTNIIINIENI